MKQFIKLIRPHHCIKNIIIFFPILFSGQLYKIELFIKSVMGFFTFFILCSVVYIINDIKDVESDRQHSTKCKRPIASGVISPKYALVMAVSLFIIAINLNAYFNNKLEAWAIFILYFAINIGYSIFGLKNLALVDIIILASGFILRIFFGSAITGITISKWLYLTVVAGSFYCSLGKRRNEIKNEKFKQTRSVLKNYSQSFLEKSMNMFMTLAIVFYSLWCIDPLTIEHHKNGNAIWTLPLVLIITLRYSMIIESRSDGDPIGVIIKDKVLICLFVFYILCMYFIIYSIKGIELLI